MPARKLPEQTEATMPATTNTPETTIADPYSVTLRNSELLDARRTLRDAYRLLKAGYRRSVRVLGPHLEAPGEGTVMTGVARSVLTDFEDALEDLEATAWRLGATLGDPAFEHRLT